VLGILALVFIVVPIAELYVIVQVAHGIGVGETILLLIAMSIIGAWMAKTQGLMVVRRLQATVADGKVPSREIVDGALILFAGALMITPGFLSDCLAILLLLPPVRAVVRTVILRRIRAGAGFITVLAGNGRSWGRGPGAPNVWDVEGWDEPPTPPDRPQLGP
jgi:UPF0716 protein FxsA